MEIDSVPSWKLWGFQSWPLCPVGSSSDSGVFPSLLFGAKEISCQAFLSLAQEAHTLPSWAVLINSGQLWYPTSSSPAGTTFYHGPFLPWVGRALQASVFLGVSGSPLTRTSDFLEWPNLFCLLVPGDVTPSLPVRKKGLAACITKLEQGYHCNLAGFTFRSLPFL